MADGTVAGQPAKNPAPGATEPGAKVPPPRPEAPKQEAPRQEQQQAPPPPPPPPPPPKAMPTNVQYLATLGLRPNATWDEVRTAYRQLARKNHPDLLRGKGAKEDAIKQAENRLKGINEAYGWLEDFYKLKPR